MQQKGQIEDVQFPQNAPLLDLFNAGSLRWDTGDEKNPDWHIL